MNLDAEHLKDAVIKGPIGVAFTPVLDYTTFFAEWMQKDDTVLMHLFPRDGEDDQWTEAHYLQRCRACRSDLRGESTGTACPRCGKTGLLYVRARRELCPPPVEFPFNMDLIIKHASDPAWDGGIAIEYIDELMAFSVQFQDCGDRIPDLDLFFKKIDEELEDERV